MKIYVAGPDVFRLDALEWAEEARELARRYGHEALIPLDNNETTADGIFTANLELITECDVLVANLNPFRGTEPDSGTAFEVGCAIALGKKVVGYLADTRPLVEKLADRTDQPLAIKGGRVIDSEGAAIENFGLPLNLMLAVPCKIVQGDLKTALDALGD